MEMRNSSPFFYVFILEIKGIIMKKVFLFSMLVFFSIFLNVFADGIPIDVFSSGDEEYHTYRIPSLIKTQKGTLIAFCEGRKNSVSDTGDIDLIYKLSKDDGKIWSKTRVLWDNDNNTCGNPCPVIDRKTGNIIMLMTWNRGDDHEMEIINGVSKDTRRVYISYSSDDGHTWSKPEEITQSVKHPDWNWYATGPGIGIQMTGDKYKNRIIIPCDHSNKNDKNWYSHIIYSDDGGKTWAYSNPIGPKSNECQIVELPDDRLLINMRNYNREYPCRSISTSNDGGLSWSNLTYDLVLIEPICQASLIKHQSTKESYLVFANPADKNKRLKMTIKVSCDYGKTWKYETIIYRGPSAYSSLYSLNENEIGILFEYGNKSPYEKIVFQKIDIQEIVGEK